MAFKSDTTLFFLTSTFKDHLVNTNVLKKNYVYMKCLHLESSGLGAYAGLQHCECAIPNSTDTRKIISLTYNTDLYIMPSSYGFIAIIPFSC